MSHAESRSIKHTCSCKSAIGRLLQRLSRGGSKSAQFHTLTLVNDFAESMMSCSNDHDAAMCLLTLGLYRDIDEYLCFFDNNELLSSMLDEGDTSETESFDLREGKVGPEMSDSVMENRSCVEPSAPEFRTAEQRTTIAKAHWTISNLCSYLNLHTEVIFQDDTCDENTPDQDVASDYARSLCDRFGSM